MPLRWWWWQENCQQCVRQSNVKCQLIKRVIWAHRVCVKPSIFLAWVLLMLPIQWLGKMTAFYSFARHLIFNYLIFSVIIMTKTYFSFRLLNCFIKCLKRLGDCYEEGNGGAHRKAAPYFHWLLTFRVYFFPLCWPYWLAD